MTVITAMVETFTVEVLSVDVSVRQKLARSCWRPSNDLFEVRFHAFTSDLINHQIVSSQPSFSSYFAFASIPPSCKCLLAVLSGRAFGLKMAEARHR